MDYMTRLFGQGPELNANNQSANNSDQSQGAQPSLVTTIGNAALSLFAGGNLYGSDDEDSFGEVDDSSSDVESLEDSFGEVDDSSSDVEALEDSYSEIEPQEGYSSSEINSKEGGSFNDEEVLEKKIPREKAVPVKIAAVTVDQDISDLQSEVIKVGFPNLGAVPRILQIGQGIWDAISKPVAYANREASYNGVGTCFVQNAIEEKKNEALDLVKNGEKSIQSNPLLNVRLIDKNDSFFMRIIKAVGRIVSNIFHKIGVAFGLCKAKSAIDIKLSADKKELKTKLKERHNVLKKVYDLYTRHECLRMLRRTILDKQNPTPYQLNELELAEKELLALNSQISNLAESDAFKDLNLEMKRIEGIEAEHDLINRFKQSSANIRRQLNDTTPSITQEGARLIYEDAFYLFKDPLTKQYRKDIHELDRKAKVEVLDAEFKCEETPLIAQRQKAIDDADTQEALALAETINAPELEQLKSAYNETLTKINKQAEIENTNDVIRDYVDFSLNEIPIVKKIAPIFPSIINQASHIVSAGLIDNSLKFLREYVFGEQNHQQMKLVLDGVRGSVVRDLTKNLKNINKIYSNNPKAQGENVSDYNISIQNKVLEELKRSEDGHDWKSALLHQAVPVLSANEVTLLSKRSDLIESATPIIQKAIADKRVETETMIKELRDACIKEIDLIAVQIQEEQIQLDSSFIFKADELAYRRENKLASEQEQIEEFRAINTAYDAADKPLKLLNEQRNSEIVKLVRDTELKIRNLRDKEFEAIEQLKASQTIDTAILARKANIKALEVQKRKSTPLVANRLENEMKSDLALVEKLKTLKAAEERIADGEAKYLESLATFVQDQILFPQGVPSDLKRLLKVSGQTEFFKDQIKAQLTLVTQMLDNPEALKKWTAEQLAFEKDAGDLAGTIKLFLTDVLGNWADTVNTIGYKEGVDLMVNRFDASRVNKYLLFSALYKAVDGTTTSARKRVEVTDGKILIKG